MVQFDQDHATISVKESVVAMIRKVGRLFAWQVGRSVMDTASSAMIDSSADSVKELWHSRLGHVSDAKLNIIARHVMEFRISTKRWRGIPVYAVGAYVKRWLQAHLSIPLVAM